MSIPPHLEAAAVAARHPRQLAVCAVREVVQVVACDQVFGVQVGAILSEGERETLLRIRLLQMTKPVNLETIRYSVLSD